MDVWIGVLAFALFLGFATAVRVCMSAIARKAGIVVKSRIGGKASISEVMYANAALVILVVLVYFKHYIFVPAVICFVIFIILSTRIESGLTDGGAIIGTTFLEWEDMVSYKLVNDEADSNVIILKIRANRKQYVLVCDRRDKIKIAEILDDKGIQRTRTINSEIK